MPVDTAARLAELNRRLSNTGHAVARLTVRQTCGGAFNVAVVEHRGRYARAPIIVEDITLPSLREARAWASGYMAALLALEMQGL